MALTLACAPLAARGEQTVPAGMGLNATLNNQLDTKHSYAGQPFSVSVVAPYPNGVSALSGANVYGHVGTVTPGGRGRNPELSLVLDKIKFSNGSSSSIGGAVTKVDPKSNKPGRILVGTVGGMLVGNWVGKALFGGSAGGAIGATTGFLLSSNNKKDFQVPAGSTLGIQLTRSLLVP